MNEPAKTPAKTGTTTSKTTTKKQTTSTANIMDQLLKGEHVTHMRKGQEMEAVIISLSKKGVTFNIGAKALAVLGDRELKEISTYLPYLKIGDAVTVRIISEESKDGYPVVSMSKFFEKGKWDIINDKKQKEEEIEVVCGEYGKGGVFVDFMGIRGVIPKIQLTPAFLDDPKKLEGQKIKVRVLEVDQIKNRLVVSQKASALNISQKELKERFDAIKVGEKYQAKVLGLSEFGIFCEINGVEGLVHISEISWEKVTDASSYVIPGETIDVMVVEKNDNDLKLNLSLKRLSHDPWDNIDEKYPKDKEIVGEVVRKERYGLFVRLEPGVEGLVHISKLTGDENFELGQKIKTFVERINRKERKMSLILPQTDKPILYR
ncbi:S1 RNA-binding domain-containing protein [Candidatus Roizmanbacteria bacterium]|nr:S1 RNA-binding domain-containing protein [Candidatus Roizmanbacteria bacterium]